MISQNQMILTALRRNCTIDPLQALRNYDCWSLRSRICEIEGKSHHKKMLKPGESIKRIPVSSKGKRYMSYRLEVK